MERIRAGGTTSGGVRDSTRFAAIEAYWDEHIHDLEIARNPVGSEAFFDELEAYRFEKLDYLPKVVDFAAYEGKRLLEVGCGVGTDLVRFARGGALVTGVDLAATSIELARKNMSAKGVAGDLSTMNGEALEFADDSFDVVYAHGVLQYTDDIERMLREIRRVLRPGGEAILMVYNRYSWLYLLSKLFGTKLEHEDAPAFGTFSIPGFRRMLKEFSHVEIIPERFPVKTKLHTGLKARVYNNLFVGAFGLLPKAVVRPFGWHIMAIVKK
jgi:ubiquinone/menaquinone biosynthesis C-methylase UbiE